MSLRRQIFDFHGNHLLFVIASTSAAICNFCRLTFLIQKIFKKTLALALKIVQNRTKLNIINKNEHQCRI